MSQKIGIYTIKDFFASLNSELIIFVITFSSLMIVLLRETLSLANWQ